MLRNADGGGGCQIFWKKALREVRGGPIFRKIVRYVTLE